MTPEVRFGVPSDLEFIMGLERGSLALPWSSDSLMELLRYTPEDTGIVYKFALVMDGIGYAGVSVVIDEAEIGNIVIAPEYRGQGYGYKLFAALIKELEGRGVKVIFLEVESTNSGALALYDKCGFVRYGVREGYYGAGRDAVLMRWSGHGDGSPDTP